MKRAVIEILYSIIVLLLIYKKYYNVLMASCVSVFSKYI